MNNLTPDFEPAKHSLDLIAPTAQRLVQLVRLAPLRVRGNHQHKVQLLGQLLRGVALVRTVHQQYHFTRFLRPAHGLNQLAPFRLITCLAGRQSPRYNVAGICGNQRKFGGPAAPTLADGLGTVFLGVPVPSGCAFMMVESRLTALMRARIRRSRCNRSNTALSTLALAARLMRV